MVPTRKRIWALAVAAAGAAGTGAFATDVLFGSLRSFSGPEDLDLTGEFVYAVNITPRDSDSFQVNGLMFHSQGSVAGLRVDAQGAVNNWGERPDYGNTSDSDGLEEVMWDISFGQRGTDVNIGADVETGTTYKLQLLFSEAWWSNPGERTFDIWVEGHKAVDEMDVLEIAGARNGSVDEGVVFTFTFVAHDDVLDIDLTQGTTGNDGNPLIAGMTLEAIVPTPASIALLGLGGLVAGRGRRRRAE